MHWGKPVGNKTTARAVGQLPGDATLAAPLSLGLQLLCGSCTKGWGTSCRAAFQLGLSGAHDVPPFLCAVQAQG